MKKIEKDYSELYGDIPRDEQKRLTYLINKLNIKKGRELIFPTINKIQAIEWKEVKFTIYLVPKGTPRPRHSPRTNTFYVKGAKDNRDIFKYFTDRAELEMIHTATIFDCKSYLPISYSAMNKIEVLLAELGFIRPIITPDWDNLGKTYSDMIQSTLLSDDCVIIDGRSRKYYSVKPRVEITMKYMEDFDSVYNLNKYLRKNKKEEVE